ncbi:MAG: hypothetical protein O3B37_06990 [Proteobacteria bacterium]|nr:hypothetical protein [Pseudomonadota bacterium]
MRWNMIRAQSRWRTPICAAFIATAAVLHTPTANADTEHFFVALDGTWRASDIVWSEIDSQWLVAATIEIAQPADIGLTALQMFSAFCSEIVRARPAAPNAAIDAEKIFRVDINILTPNGRSITSAPAPISVAKGKCQVGSGEQTFLPTYPGKLQGWNLANGNVRQNGETYRRIILFEPSQGSRLKVADFDMALACTATLNDPTVQTLQNTLEQRLQNITLEPNIVVIYAKESGAQGVFAQAAFDTSDGTCVELK